MGITKKKMFLARGAGGGGCDWNDISTASFVAASDTDPPELNPADVAMSDDGLVMFTLHNGNVYEWDLSIAFDSDTKVYNGVSLVVGNSSNQGLTLEDGGTRLYITRWNPDEVIEYGMTANDLSTASLTYTYAAGSINSVSIAWNSGGTWCLIVGATPKTVVSHTCSTPWALSSISAAIDTFDVTSEMTTVQSIFLHTCGTKLYITGTATTRKIFQYSLDPEDLDSISYDSDLLGSIGTGAIGITIKNNGTKLYIADTGADVISEYDL